MGNVRVLPGYLWVCLLGLTGISFPVAAQTNFGEINLGSSSAQTVTVTVPSATVLSSVVVLTQGAPNLDFTDAGGGTCVKGSAYTASCTVNVAFSPKISGPRFGAVVLAGPSGVISTTYLTGVGAGAQLLYNDYNSAPQLLPASLNGLATAVGVDGGGNVYVGDNGSATNLLAGLGRILKLTASGGQYTQTTIASGFYSPAYVGIDGAGNVYVHTAAMASTTT